MDIEEKLKFYQGDLNKYHSNIKFTLESNKESVNFLDLNIGLQENT